MNSFVAKILMFIISIILIAVILIAVVISSDNNSEEGAESTENILPETSMVEHVRDGTISVTISGPIVAREQHYRVRMEINSTNRVLEVSNGYDGSGIERRRYANDETAFREFLGALEQLGLEKELPSTEEVTGYCATGERYEYNFDSPLYELERWSNSCDKVGNLAARGPSVRNLFRAQFPDYNEMVEDLEVIDYHFRP